VETAKAKQICIEYRQHLVATCWPQTIIIFIAIYRSESNLLKYVDLPASLPPDDVPIISNSYYLFETSIYAMLRTAISIEQITGKEFVLLAKNSMLIIRDFDEFKEKLLEDYCFYNLLQQQKDFKNSVIEAHKTIPLTYRAEIDYLYKYVILPEVFLITKCYVQYVGRIKFSDLKTNFINKLKIISPLGFNAMIAARRLAKTKERIESKKTEIESNSGYF
jgi:hypothetical protein